MKAPPGNAVTLNAKSWGALTAIKIGRLNWPEFAGVSWSEFAAGTLRAQMGYFEGESGGGLNLAETRVVSVPGEGLEPSRGKPSQDFKSWKWNF